MNILESRNRHFVILEALIVNVERRTSNLEPRTLTIVAPHMRFALGQLEIGFHHHANQILKSYLWLPAQNISCF
jgi:hypothetical protein